MSKYKIYKLPYYIDEDFKTEFLPCPRCGSDYVEWTNCRDLNILNQSAYCHECDLSTFHVDTTAFNILPNLDYETTLKKYNAWVKTNPTSYGEEDWSE